MNKNKIEIFGASGVGKSYFLSKIICNNYKFMSVNKDFTKAVMGKTKIEKLDLLLYKFSGKIPNIFMRGQWTDFIMKNQRELEGFWTFLNNRSSLSFHGSEFILAYHFLYSFARMNILINWKSSKVLFLDEGLMQRLLGLNLALSNKEIKKYVETYLKISPVRKFIYCHADIDLIIQRVMERKIHGIHLGKEKAEIIKVIKCDTINALKIANYLKNMSEVEVISFNLGKNVKDIEKKLGELI